MEAGKFRPHFVKRDRLSKHLNLVEPDADGHVGAFEIVVELLTIHTREIFNMGPKLGRGEAQDTSNDGYPYD